MIMSAGVVPGVGFAAAAASCFVAGSQVGGSDCGGGMLRRWRVRTWGIVDGVARVLAKKPSSPVEGFRRRESVGIGV